ncbi:hypothetical protein [Alkalicoccus halolimnae]|uniref:GerMN domain-containing protein n=1 Tax=Alkalicoccus halolimnae TaxID=1667239 RepID=A0A5C7F202_9BACI|nr:hypothetical protein [Alkalicoccus halolimnae]TXF83958.1 hypothetical protein FTX54_11755 [Alkalicoccus halolimnae]
MSKNKWTEKEIEKTLTRMPKVEDRQTKDELFQAVERRRAKGPGPRKKQWFFPAMASAAAVLLIVLMLPSFMNSGLFMSSDNQAPQNNFGSTALNNNEAAVEENGEPQQNESEEAAPDQPDNEGDSEADTENNGPQENNADADAEVADDNNENMNREENDEDNLNQPENNTAENSGSNSSNSENENEADVNVREAEENETDENDSQEEEPEQPDYAYEEESSVFVTAVVSEEESGQRIIVNPVETDGITNKDLIISAIKESDPTSGGYFQELEDVILNSPGEGDVTLEFSDNQQLASLSSYENMAAEEVLQEILAIYQASEVYFTENDEEIGFGQGESSFPISSLNRGYYAAGENLVSARAVEEPMTNGAGDPLSFGETLEAMAEVEEDSWYESAIPEELSITDVRYEEETAYVYYDYEEVEEAEMDQFKKAVQLTAKYFTLDTVQLVNEEQDEVTILPVRP